MRYNPATECQPLTIDQLSEQCYSRINQRPLLKRPGLVWNPETLSYEPGMVEYTAPAKELCLV